jgi:hypothetical protein
MLLEISIPRMLFTRLLGRVSRRAYFAPTSPLRLAYLPDPPLPAPGWVRVHNRLCSICSSDLHQLLLDAGPDVAPVALPFIGYFALNSKYQYNRCCPVRGARRHPL